ncbi:MAG: hypothetical protein Q8L47_04365 [bacterium]|nr:hypothetical protein [bacterium]
MSLGNWLAHWIRGPNTWTPEDFSLHEITAIFAGGLGEPRRSLNAMRALLLQEYNIGSIVGSTYTVLDLPPYPYEKAENVGRALYLNTKRHLEENEESRIIIIGHSLGGIFALQTVQRLIREGYGDRVHKIFLLGAPLYGVDPKVFLLNNFLIRDTIKPLLDIANRELAELTSIFLHDIPREKIVTIYSEGDILVHRSQATISGATNISVGSGHLLMIACPHVAKIIHSHL